MNQVTQMPSSCTSAVSAPQPAFPLDRWWVAGFAWELGDKPLARTLLGRPMVLFRRPDGRVAALEDRCCHKELPLSCGTLEDRGLRCGYHGMLFDSEGACIEIPGQDRIPAKACVRAYPLRERDKILWVWVGSTPDSLPTEEPPPYPWHADARYRFGGDSFHYNTPYQLIHDNLLDLSHLGYVHLKTIGGNPSVHMNAKLEVKQQGDVVSVIRHMPASAPPPTYVAAWPFKGLIDRWQEVEFHVSHLLIWTGAMDAGTGNIDDPLREGFHLRGFHGITPETESTCHYFWTMATNPHPDKPDVTQVVVDQTAATFHEDKTVIEAQWNNQRRFPDRSQVDIHVDVGPNRARRVIDRLLKTA
ncbi:aromatic ring-hydroxylating dioxygenase subunit alpha [Roseateles koreensis]|uniref:Aromatic ring-hydroxylating dioxygenase subunit alpha n=1 Tax=Roseateles koreensis TaxID=2987526 RepID=A0ABT5KP87_9BURK|nr:aromatic ring-hydroxylating dioxygenase subunit alpha [Roseateles koreensis]MDC8784666.1 aromatic ring-hydroxylating dioxygenase subunit alpha [Roseateles koreensis]